MSVPRDPASVDPDLRAPLAAMPALGGLSDGNLKAVRAALSGVPALHGTDAQGVNVRRVEIAGRSDDALSALLYLPPDDSSELRAGLLNLHGGGYVAGSAQREDATARELCGALGSAVLVPDYRLAPECPYPAALDDAAAALDWLHSQAAELRLDPMRIGMRGVSAGGGLAAGLALRNRDANRSMPCGLQLIYPMLDDRTGEHAACGQHVWTAQANRYGWDSLLRGQDRARPPAAAVPARATDLSGLPPTFIAVGSIDLFARENLGFASRLIDAGVPVELHLYPGAYHGFALVTQARCAQAVARDAIAWLGRNLNEAPWDPGL